MPQRHFLTRAPREVNKTDEVLASLTLGDRPAAMYTAWVKSGGSCHLFMVNSTLFARGNKLERQYAAGFVSGWRSALKQETETNEEDI